MSISPKSTGIKIFLDTNIILDILDDKRQFHPTSVKLYQLIEAGELDAYISESVLTTTDYLLQKITTRGKRADLISILLDFLQVLPCSTKICRKALQSNFPDMEDSVLYHIALDHSLDYFITNDKGVKKLSVTGLPVISAKEFLNING